jgi:HPt (histidine-containing phosphotransfer) domain-containing protein
MVGGEVVFDSRTGFDRRSGKRDRRKGYDRRLFTNGITGVDINKGVERFSGDWETYLSVLQSFLTNTRSILETVKEVNSETLSAYAITVHGIKSSCRGIFAEEAGNRAEALEKAAKAGDLDFVIANNPAFIETVSELLTEIDGEFAKSIEKKDKPKKDKPYSEALSKLVAACECFNAAEIDAIMEEIEAFDYKADNGLVFWLRENVNQMNFMEVAEKLSGFEKENGGKL